MVARLVAGPLIRKAVGDMRNDIKMPTISVKADVAHVMKWIDRDMKKEMPFVISLALNRTAKQVRLDSKEIIRQQLDEPKGVTINATWVDYSSKTKQEVMIYPANEPRGRSSVAPSQWLKAIITGGRRAAKASEKRLRMTGRMNANQYMIINQKHRNRAGNITGGKIEQILSQLGSAEIWSGYNANETSRSKAKAKGRNRYFTMSRGGRPIGVFLRKGDKIENVIGFTNRAPSYSKQLRFYEYTENLFNKHWPTVFREVVRQKLKI